MCFKKNWTIVLLIVLCVVLLLFFYNLVTLATRLPSSTLSLLPTVNESIRKSNGAVTLTSIFIATTIIIQSPFFNFVPSLQLISSTVPGSGDAISQSLFGSAITVDELPSSSASSIMTTRLTPLTVYVNVRDPDFNEPTRIKDIVAFNELFVSFVSPM